MTYDKLYNKYSVVRRDGDPEHPDCRYFVLDLDHDPVAIQVALQYADLIEARKPGLAAGLREMCRGGFLGVQCQGPRCNGQGRLHDKESLCNECQRR